MVTISEYTSFVKQIRDHEEDADAEKEVAMDTQELIRQVRDYVFALYPDEDLIAITLDLRSGPLRLPVPKRSPDESGLRDSERLVFSHLPRGEEPGITIEEILRKTGYSDKSYVHKILKSLRSKGLCGQDKAKGHRRTE